MEKRCGNTIKRKGVTLVCGRNSHQGGSCRDFKVDAWFSKNSKGDYVVMPRNPVVPNNFAFRMYKTRVDLLYDVLNDSVRVAPRKNLLYYNVRKKRYLQNASINSLAELGLVEVIGNCVLITEMGNKVLLQKRGMLSADDSVVTEEEKNVS